MATRLMVSLLVGLGIVVILGALQIGAAAAVGIGIGSGAFVSVLLDSRRNPRPAWAWAALHGVTAGVCATLLVSWLS